MQLILVFPNLEAPNWVFRVFHFFDFFFVFLFLRSSEPKRLFSLSSFLTIQTLGLFTERTRPAENIPNNGRRPKSKKLPKTAKKSGKSGARKTPKTLILLILRRFIEKFRKNGNFRFSEFSEPFPDCSKKLKYLFKLEKKRKISEIGFSKIGESTKSMKKPKQKHS